MRISDIEVHKVGKYLFVSVHTDAGIEGIGEAGAWPYLDAVASAVNKWRGYLIGQDPATIERHWQYMYQSTYFRGSVIMSALSAIDIALWDIKGKSLGVPVNSLLGGATRDRARTYAPVSCGTEQQMASRCEELRRQGFTAARLIIVSFASDHENAGDEGYSTRVNAAIRRVLACREAVGPDFDLCVEAHRAFTPQEAIAIGNGIASANPLFFEDPIAPDSAEAMADIAKRIPVAIATGERAVSVHELYDLMAKGAARYIRPDVCALGGITPSIKAAAIAEAHYVSIAPHNPLGPISTAACLQLDASVSNFLIQEHPSFNTDGSEDGMVAEPLRFEDGYLAIPQSSGIGVELAASAAEDFPPTPRDLTPVISFDGSVRGR